METDKHPWLPAEPRKLPQPTYWPFFLALGVVLILWGIPTTKYLSVIGGVVSVISLIKWINILRHE